ncbi:uncharacterized protein BYT42DRAFT_647817 [Radiomyces spectabilis]|uniref:uncharacterized protein n=1 Tax=Radiomyces spectabilis TaxID=64574 RepID=UPI002221287D|nr:uncharacterized protein BYT42DRAFT_647817 [Radiomyces spectabilis]KAI8370587.1 hypothetical protein BYT42DRAFT_647817 [Radiomyces spectabilis]
MPPRLQATPIPTQRPLQSEILLLHKLLSNDILQQSTRILDHFTVERIDSASAQHLKDVLLQKCADFELVCDQIYYILEQSKRVLQLDKEQKLIQQRAEQQKQDQQQRDGEATQEQTVEALDTDLTMGYDLSMAVDGTQMMDTDLTDQPPNPSQQQQGEPMEEEDLEELLQLQKERMERLRNVVIYGMDAESLKSKGDRGNEDLLF